ncbi:T9SS type A sorting domain-containing protein [Flavobacterium sp. NKUCC04_CG]|uniref:Ig-like domain-containing protein n=1 Tax=Flavobacterium sp. NKUCC04_CG TaxID=2842121 RepID=UPI001C5AE7A9|nr:T9SS type A sorting domain-containing protein [Flavobacterium sp. NKUCC04_CG]MBW3517696.1 T9SS type A sorting domain-containing protein [Flavobacterium sp. NKUCC04_CG]
MKKIILCLFFVLFNILSSWGQVDIGSGTLTQRFPLGNFYGFERSASLYTAEEVMGTGDITALSWYAITPNSLPRPIVIYLKEVDDDVLSGVAWDVITAGAVKVYDAMFSATSGWNHFTLSTPFNFTGTKNLLVLVEANFGGSGDSNGSAGNGVRYTTAAGKHMSIVRDYEAPDQDGTVGSNRPNIRIAIPLQGCVSPLMPDPIHVGGTSVRFSISLRASYPSYEYELRSSGEPESGVIGLEQSGISSLEILQLSGLAEDTNYVLYIRTLCDAGETSGWVSQGFTTVFEGQIGRGTQTESSLPIQSHYGYNYSQQIYLADEVLNAVGENRYITKIKFHFTSIEGTNNYKDWKIFMGNTTISNFESTDSTEWVKAANMITVFNGEVTFPNPTGNWMEINLMEPFLWDGTSNLVVAVHEYTPNFTSGARFRAFQTRPVNRGMLYRTDNEYNNPNPHFPPEASFLYQYVPQIILVGEQVSECMGIQSHSYENLTDTSVKIKWVNSWASAQQIEYYLGNTPQPPTADALPTAVVSAEITEVILNDLTSDTPYYVWFRNACQQNQKSNWSGIPLEFRTLLPGQLGHGDRLLSALPIASNYSYNYSQQIYLANEVRTALQSNNYITGIKFHVNLRDTELNQEKYKDWTIYMGNTSKVQFDDLSNTEWIPTSELERVYRGTVTFPSSADGWMEINFSNPFLWDRTSNIVVAVHENTPGSGTSSNVARFRIQHTVNNRGMLRRSSGDVNVNQLPRASVLYKAVPQIILNAELPPPCSSLSGGYEYTALTSSSVNFEWAGREGIRGVEYFMSTSNFPPDNDTEITGQVLSPNNQLALEGLNEATTYYIWFRVWCDGDSRSDWSISPTSFTTLYPGQIGGGGLTTASLPLDSNQNFNYSQQIYLASEVLQAIGENRYIDKIKFHFNSNNATDSYKDWRIFMGNTTKTSFESTTQTEWIGVADMKVVFNGTVSFPEPTGDWMEISLEEPFLWDGTSNIVIGVHEFTPGNNAGAVFRKTDTGDVYRGLLAKTQDDIREVDPYNIPIATNRFTYVPQIILSAQPTPACIGVSTFGYSYVGFNSAVLLWSNLISGYVGTEYFLTTDITQAPSPNSMPTGITLPGVTSITLNNLMSDTEYYVWFRNRCTADESSAWSVVPLVFRTHIEGLISDGSTEISTFLPLYSLYAYNYSQQLYMGSELKSVLGADGRKYITKLRLHVNIPQTSIWTRYEDWNIFMGNTTKHSFEGRSATEWVPTTAMRQVFDGVVSFPNPTDAWMEITLQDPFVWDGESNLVIAVNEYSPGWSSGAAFRVMNTAEKRGMIHYTDIARQNLHDLSDANYDFNHVPQIFIVSEAVPNCFPPTAVRVLDVDRYSATVRWEVPFEGVPENGYKYEIRTEGVPGSGDEGLALTGTVQNTILLQNLIGLMPATTYTIYFQALCGVIDESPWTPGVSFTTICEYPDFEVVEVAPFCGQGIADLSVIITGVSGNFKWFDVPEGGVEIAEGQVFTTPLLTETTSYWVEGLVGSDDEVCLNPAGRKMVTVVVTDGLPFELSESTFDICEGDYTTRVFYLGDLSTYDTYTWSPSIGVSGDVQRGWVFNPAITTEYILTAKQNRGDFCEFARKVRVRVQPLPVVKITPREEIIVVCKDEVQTLEIELNEINYSGVVGQAENLTTRTEEITAFSNRRRSVKAQLLFKASELRENGVSSGSLNSIAFNIATAGHALINENYTLRVGTTTLDKFATASFETTGFTTVYGPITYTHTATGWQEIVFDTPFEWDGVSNLILEFSHSGADRLDNAETYYTTTVDNMLLFSYNDFLPMLSTRRLNVKFTGGQKYNIKWSPTENVYLDPAATIPYSYDPEVLVKKVYYKGAIEGYENLAATIDSNNGCFLVKNFNLRTVLITNAQATNQDFCGVVRIADLVATGQEGASFYWYSYAEGGRALDATTPLSTQTYFVTQVIGLCESETRVPVRVTIRPKPVNPIVVNNAVCYTGTLADLIVSYDVSNTLNWYDADHNLITGNIMLDERTLYVSQSSVNCESERVRVDVVVGTAPTVPFADANQYFCNAARVADLSLDLEPTAVARWYSDMESIVALSPNDFLETGTYYGAQLVGGCESTRVRITVIVADFIAEPIVSNQNLCNTSTTVAQLQVTGLPGAEIHWYGTETGGIPLGPNQAVYSGLYYVSQQIGNCESTRVRVGIHVADNNRAPDAQAQSFCGDAKVQDLHVVVGTGFIVKWYAQQEGGTVLSEEEVLQTGTYYVSQSIYHCESPRKSVEVNVNPRPMTPTGNEVQEFEPDFTAVVGDLELNEPAIIWFSSEEEALNDINRLDGNMPLIDGDFYFGVVQSEDGCLSLPFKVQVSIKLGVHNFDLTKLNYYPNPVHDVLTISYHEKISRVEVYALTGHRVLTLNTSDNVVFVDMGRLAAATYIVKIYSDKQQQFLKVLKY